MRPGTGRAILFVGCASALAVLSSQPWIERLQSRSAPRPRQDTPTNERSASDVLESARADAEHVGPPGVELAPTMSEWQIVHGTTPLRDRLLGVAALPENKRKITAWKLGDELGKSRDRLAEVLKLLNAEEDPVLLYWLGEIIRGGGGALATLTEPEWARLAPMLSNGQPAERRRAVAGIHSEFIRTPPPETSEALKRCLETEMDPSVLAVAARNPLVVRAAWERMADDVVAAIRRMPEGRPRREMTYVYKRLSNSSALYARFLEAWSEGERNDWGHAISIAWSEGRLDEAENPGRRFAEVYSGVTDPEVRLRLLRSCPPDRSLIRELMARETDVRLRKKLGKLRKKRLRTNSPR